MKTKEEIDKDMKELIKQYTDALNSSQNRIELLGNIVVILENEKANFLRGYTL